MSPDQGPNNSNAADGSSPGLLGRLLATRRAKIVTGMVLLSALGVATGGWFLMNSLTLSDVEQPSMELALRALDARKLLRAQQLADQLRTIPGVEAGAPAFVMGAAAAYETDERWEKDKANSYLLAARHLEEAREKGFPEGRAGEGLRLLGRCFYLSGQYAKCRPVLEEALAASPRLQGPIHRLLSQAYSADADPNYEQALAHNAAYLATLNKDDAERDTALIERARVLVKLDRLEEVHKILAQIPTTSSERGSALVLEGQLLLQAARVLKNDPKHQADGTALEQAKPKYEQAIARFREAQSTERPGHETAGKAMYLIGVCYAETNQLRAAQEQLERTRQLHYDTAEGLAANLLLAELLHELQEPDESLAAYRRTLVAAGRPEEFSNPWFTLDKFRSKLLSAYHRYLEDSLFDHAMTLLEGFRPIFDREQTLELSAAVYRAWAQALATNTNQTEREKPLENQTVAAELQREAGLMYARLARLRKATAAYPEALWNSAASLLDGQDHENAIRILDTYLKTEPRHQRSQALVALGKANLIVGHLDESIAALTECIHAYPLDAAVYDARIWCAEAYLEKGMPNKAEELLRANLNGDVLTPASRQWRESLFRLGKVLHDEGQHIEAINKLEEAVARYPDLPESTQARYLIAEAYREAAKAPKQKLAKVTIESVRIVQRRQLLAMLEGALKNYHVVQKLLNRREEEVELTDMEYVMLRNCYFSIGMVLFDLGRYEQAIIAFSDASTRYQNEPLVLEAFLQISNCHRRLGHEIEARGALAQAQVVLKRLSPNLAFTETTNFSHEEWGRVLEQLAQW